jgi:hypothetical protein
MSQKAVSAVIIQNSARVPKSWLPHKFISLKILGPLFLITFPFPTVHVEFFAIFSSCLHFAKFVCLLCHYSCHHSPPPPGPFDERLTKNRYFETGYGEKLGLVWRNRKKIINDYLYLPFFLLFILWRAAFKKIFEWKL